MPYYICSPIFPIRVELRTDPSSKCHDYNTLRTLPASSASEFFSFFFPAVPVSEFFSFDLRLFKLLDRASYPLCADLPEISSVHARRTKRQIEMPEIRCHRRRLANARNARRWQYQNRWGVLKKSGICWRFVDRFLISSC